MISHHYRNTWFAVVVLIILGALTLRLNRTEAAFMETRDALLSGQADLESPTAPGDEFWSDRFNMVGTNRRVQDILVAPDNTVYIAGEFEVVNNLIAKGIAKWDGTQWVHIGNADSVVTNLALDSEGTLYALGSFQTIGGVPSAYVARWDGVQWGAMPGLPLGSGPTSIAIAPDDTVYVSAVYGGPIYRWDGTTWVPLPAPPTLYYVEEITVAADGSLYAGGRAHDPNYGTVVKWDGSSWTSVGNFNTFNWVSAVESLYLASDGSLYVGGDFYAVNGVVATGIAKWDGTTWSALGTGLSDPSQLNVLAIHQTADGTLYVGGSFNQAGGSTVNNIARWNGTTWSPLGGGAYLSTVYALASTSDGALLVAAPEITTPAFFSRGIARWQNGTWSGLGTGHGLNDEVWALAKAPDGSLYVGGAFYADADGTPLSGVAYWNGTSWQDMGRPGSDIARAMVVSPTGTLYAAGWNALSQQSWVARWDGTTWTTLASLNGMNQVYTLALGLDGSLYAGGRFATIGTVSANRIARWDGNAWYALGSGINGDSVQSLSVAPNGTLVIGGFFSSAGGVSAANIAKWDGTTWSAFGTGMNDRVSAVVAGQGILYAAGRFTNAGGTFAYHIARWNGTQWSALDPNTLLDTIHTLALSPDGAQLYAGGTFNRGGNNIARWNGSSWQALGSGVAEGLPTVAVYALAPVNGGVYVGGDFQFAGAKPSVNIGLYDEGHPIATATTTATLIPPTATRTPTASSTVTTPTPTTILSHTPTVISTATRTPTASSTSTTSTPTTIISHTPTMSLTATRTLTPTPTGTALLRLYLPLVTR